MQGLSYGEINVKGFKEEGIYLRNIQFIKLLDFLIDWMQRLREIEKFKMSFKVQFE